MPRNNPKLGKDHKRRALRLAKKGPKHVNDAGGRPPEYAARRAEKHAAKQAMRERQGVAS